MAEVYSDPTNYSTSKHHRRSNPVSHAVRFQGVVKRLECPIRGAKRSLSAEMPTGG